MNAVLANDTRTDPASALRAAGLTVRREEEAAWSGSFGGWPYPWNARLADEWLTFELRLAGPAAEDLELLARSGSSLAGGAKFAVTADGGAALGFEVRLPSETESEVWLQPALEGVDAGLRAWSLTAAGQDARAGSGKRAHIVAYRGAQKPLATEELRLLAEESGWPAKLREQAVVVDLAVADGFHQATLLAEAGAMRAFTEVLPLAGLSLASRCALALALLRVNGAVRGVAGSLYGVANHESMRLAVTLPARPDAGALGEALTALSAACRWTHREFAALADPALAADYLAIGGFPLNHQPQPKTQTPP